MPICPHCGHALTCEETFADQIGSAYKETFGSMPHIEIPENMPASSTEVFHALLYLGRSHDFNDLLAFHLLHQIFVFLSRHDCEQDLPSLDEIWRKAEQKALEAVELAV